MTVCRPWDKDRFMTPDIESVTKLLQEEKVGILTECVDECGCRVCV